MDTSSFNRLLAGRLGTLVSWQASHRCPCVLADGGSAADCPLCHGVGDYWDAPTAPFKIGLTNLRSSDIGRMRAKFGPDFTGDASLSIPSSAPCYGLLKPKDRFQVPGATDPVEWVLKPRTPVRLPPGATGITAFTLQGGALVPATLPDPDASGRISVARGVVVRMRVPRTFQIADDAGHLRAWQSGLPQAFVAVRVDITLR